MIYIHVHVWISFLQISCAMRCFKLIHLQIICIHTFQEPKPQIVITNPPSNSIPDTSPQSTNESPVHNRTDEEKAAEAISDDITDEDKAEAEHREEVQRQVSARIFSGITRISEMHEACTLSQPSAEGGR